MIILLPSKIAALVELPRELRVHRLASFFEKAWALAMNGQARVAVGIYCERDWLPANKACPMQNTAEALMAAGGLPVPIYLGGGEAPDQLRRVSGLLLPGGSDIDPSLYGAIPGGDTQTDKLDPENDRFQRKCVQLATQMGLPMLGVCRGAQMLNVAHGGTLEQSLPAGHEQDEPTEQATHPVRIRPDSEMEQAAGTHRAVNSKHHQAVGEVAEGFHVTALAPDGTIECIERKRPWAVGCEFHPENQRKTDASQENFFLRLVRQAERVVIPTTGQRVRIKVHRSGKSRVRV